MRRIVVLVCLPLISMAQTFVPIEIHPSNWACAGEVWIHGSNLYCEPARSGRVSKTLLGGREVFESLHVPQGSRPCCITVVTEDADHNIYAADRERIHIYSPEGQYQKSITPGVTMSTGLEVLDAEHIFVTGRLGLRLGPSKSTIFLVGTKGVVQSFSDVFVPGLRGLDDRVMNEESSLALDRKRGLLYQLPESVYEIRVFDLEAHLRRTIVPPEEYRWRAPKLRHDEDGSVAVEPNDGASHIDLLADGGFAVSGDILDRIETVNGQARAAYSRFVDVYGADGNFRARLSGDQLRIEGASLLRFDRLTGKAFFWREGSLIEAQLRSN